MIVRKPSLPWSWPLLAVCLGLAACQSLPPPLPKIPSSMLPPPASGPLVRMSDKVKQKTGSGRDGLLPVTGNKEALDYRLAFIDSAERSLDIMMFIWLRDLSGRLVLERILQAADRGVRVRLLLDDFVLPAGLKDRQLAAINTHPNVTLRIYNPFHTRSGLAVRAIEMLRKPAEVNQRMHNKAIIADSSVAILSGRNVGNHCFGLAQSYNNVDLGVVVTGPAVAEIGAGFDNFWKSEPSYNVAAFAPAISPRELLQFREQSHRRLRKAYRKAGREVCLHRRDWSHQLHSLRRRMHAGRAHYVQDPPEVPSAAHPVIQQTLRMAARARKDLIMVNLYIVPDEKMLNLIRCLKKRGVRVRLLVPSIGSNHNPVVYNQYQKYRKMLLRLGMEIHELKGDPCPSGRKFLDEGSISSRRVKLHAKAVVVDNRYCYMGTLNLDGRSRTVNTEEGLLIDSPPFVRELRSRLEQLMLPGNAWKLSLDIRGDLVWTSATGVRRKEPTINRFQAVVERILRPFDLNNATFPDHQLYKRPETVRP